MSSNSAPPPGFNFSFQQQFGNPSNGSNAFSPAAIAIIGILGAAFLIVSYHTALARFCRGSRDASRRNGVSGEAGDQHEGAVAILTRGLEESVIQAIPVYKYAKDEGLVDGSECSVCLGEFQNDETLRLLPKCNHAFHLSCIDQWLHTHSNCPLCRANIATPGLQHRPDSPRVVTGENHGNAAEDRQVMQETGDSANLRSGSDQRSSEPAAYNPNDHRFTNEGEVEPPNSLNLEDMPNARCSDLVGIKSFSTGRALNDRQDGRKQLSSARDDGRAPPIIQRSCSMSSIYDRPEGGLEQLSSTKTIVYDVLPGNEGRQLLWHQSHDENNAPSKTGAGVRLFVDMESTCSSSSHSSPTDLVSSRSFNYVTALKSKEESMNPPQLAKSLLSFKAGSFAVKRSFSGGRLFGFRSKNSPGIVNSRLPI